MRRRLEVELCNRSADYARGYGSRELLVKLRRRPQLFATFLNHLQPGEEGAHRGTTAIARELAGGGRLATR